MRPLRLLSTALGVVTLSGAGLVMSAPASAAKPAPAPKAALAPKAAASSAAPTTPSAAICADHSVLDGPATAPLGAVRVNPGTDLYATAQANPPGTTFWLAPGTHTLGNDQFSQVVPKDGDTFVGAPGAILDGRGLNRYAFTQTATGVTIRYLTIQNFVSPNNESVVNHDSGPNWTVEYTTIRNNKGAGVAMGTNNVIRYSCLTNNGQYGFTAFRPGTVNLTFDHNEVSYNDADDIETSDPYCGCSGGGKFFDVRQAVVTANWVHHNKAQGLFADTNAVGFLFEGNYINDNTSEGLVYETSYNAYIHNNTLVRNALRKGAIFAARNDSFPVTAIYLQESGGDARVNNGIYSTLEVSGNHLVDNWGGVTIWENADRFCNTVGSTAAGFCPIAGVATVAKCTAPTISTAPYYDDCRWKAQNISVHDNDFILDKSAINCSNNCGQQGLFSNAGSSPSWSPYQGNVIQQAVTYHQNNHFSHNSYVGNWLFDSYSPGNGLSFAQWQASPSLQDLDSTSASGLVNDLDANTATLEGSLGQWAPWFSATPSQSTQAAHAGTHALKVDVTAPWGWGIQTRNWPGFATSPGAKTISFWGLAGSGSNLGATMYVHWRNASGAYIQTDQISIASLNATTWLQAGANVVAPSGTAWVSLEFTSSSGVAGNSLDLDDIFVGSGSTPPPPPPPPPPPSTNLLDADTAGLESSIGHWEPWFSVNCSRSTTAAHSGTHSLRVDVTAPWGWGVQLDNAPGFAAAAGPKTIGFWALAGAGSPLAATMTVHWRNSSGVDVQVDTVGIASLSASWQQATANVTAPAGTAKVSIEVSNSKGVPGNVIYLDDLMVANA